MRTDAPAMVGSDIGHDESCNYGIAAGLGMRIGRGFVLAGDVEGGEVGGFFA